MLFIFTKDSLEWISKHGEDEPAETSLKSARTARNAQAPYEPYSYSPVNYRPRPILHRFTAFSTRFRRPTYHGAHLVPIRPPKHVHEHYRRPYRGYRPIVLQYNTPYVPAEYNHNQATKYHRPAHSVTVHPPNNDPIIYSRPDPTFSSEPFQPIAPGPSVSFPAAEDEESPYAPVGDPEMYDQPDPSISSYPSGTIADKPSVDFATADDDESPYTPVRDPEMYDQPHLPLHETEHDFPTLFYPIKPNNVPSHFDEEPKPGFVFPKD